MTAIKNKPSYYLKMLLLSMPITFLTAGHTFLLAYIVDQAFLKKTSIQALIIPLLLLFLVFMAKPLINGIFEWHNRKEAAKAKQNLRNALNKALIHHEDAFETENTTGYFATLACDGIESTDAYYAEFVPQIIIMGVNTLLLLGFAFYLDWISALIMAFTAPLIPVFMILIGKTAEGVNLKQWRSLSRMNGHLLDLLRGLTTLKHFQKDKQQIEAVSTTSEDFKNKTMSVLKLTFLSAFALELTATLSTAVIAVSLGVRLLYGKIEFFPALTVLLLAPEYYLPLRQLGLKYHAAMNAKSVSIKLKPFLTLVQNDQSNSDQEKNIENKSALIDENAQWITLSNLNFAYDANSNIFSDLNMKIPLTGATALTGASGVGKTTLLKLLSKDLVPQSGRIQIGQTDLSTLNTETLFNYISVVPQKPRVFMGTLYENLSFGRPDVSVLEILDASEITGFSKVISRLPEGLDSRLGEGRQALSGGETQLLAITRAYLRNTPVILLDEPSSALDPITEEWVTEALKKISETKCLIIAAHRKASIGLCNNVIHLGGEALDQ